MPTWTQDQRQAIDKRNTHLLVGAGAGSGKTAVLVERILTLVLTEGQSIDRFLVMTFTKAASREMKTRISQRLEEALVAASNPTDQAFIQKQLDRLPAAHISTIHSFCGQLARTHFDILDIDPASKIIDPEEERMLIDQVVDEVMMDFYEHESDWFLPLVESLCQTRNDQGFRDLVVRLYNFLRGLPDPLPWLDRQLAHFYVDKDEDEPMFYQDISESLVGYLKRARVILNDLQKLVALDLPYLEKTQEADEQLLKALEELASTDIKACIGALSNLSFTRKAAKKKDMDVDELAEDAYKYGRDLFKNILSKDLKPLAGLDLDVTRDDVSTVYQRLLDLREVVARLMEALSGRKRQEQKMSFDDMEHFALKVLSNPSAQSEVRDSYDYVFVDEYQDTSYLQEAIIGQVAREDNLFMVGDVKQSIYRFRKAAPEIFVAKKEKFRKEEGGNLVVLNKNFRSSAPIVETINHLFSQLMNQELGEIDYDETESLDYGGLVDDEVRPVELHLIDKDRLDLSASDFKDLLYQEREASVAASLLIKAHNQPFYDHKLGQIRPMEWKDMVVLLRATKGYGDRYMEVLNQQNIPVYMDKPPGYFDAIEISVMLETLKLVDNKDQDHPWLSFLRSPMIGADDDLLAGLLAKRGEKTICACLYEKTHEPGIEHAKALVSQWQKKKDYLGVGYLLEAVFRESDWMDLVGAMPGGDQRQANLSLLLHRAHQYGSTKAGGLSGFLQGLEKMEEKEVDPGLGHTIGEKSNVVRILTVHRAKGLEYPLVLLGGMGKSFNQRDVSQAGLLLHPLLGLGPDYVNVEAGYRYKMVQRMRIERQLILESESEELRILYVALTRAKNRLLMVGGLSTKAIERLDNPYMKPFLQAGSFAEWVYPLIDQFCGLFLNKTLVDEEILHEALWRKSVDHQSRGSELREIIEERAQKMDDKQRVFKTWPLQDKLRARLPGKLGVTDVYRLRNQGLAAYLHGKPLEKRRPAFLLESQPLGAQRGLAMHDVMQRLDFSRVANLNEIRAQIEEMVEKEMLTVEAAQLVDPAKIVTFFEGSMGQRILKSRRIYREYPFNLQINASELFPEASGQKMDAPILLQGVIDMVFEEDDQLVLLDYKTDQLKVNLKDASDARYAKYKQQLSLYKRALQVLDGRKVGTVALYLFDRSETLEMEV